MSGRVTIGEFSRASHLSVKTLRRYHEVGLLEPSEADPHNGYRYCAAVSSHEAGAPGGDHAAAIEPACCATTAGSVACVGRLVPRESYAGPAGG